MTIFLARSASRLALKKKPAAMSTCGGCGCQPSRATASLSKIAQMAERFLPWTPKGQTIAPAGA